MQTTWPQKKRRAPFGSSEEAVSLTAEEARALAKRPYKNNQGGVTFCGTPEAVASDALLQRYKASRRQLGACDSVEHFGLHLFRDFLSSEEAGGLLAYLDSLPDEAWEMRKGFKGRDLAGSKRKNFGVDNSYAPKLTWPLPPPLEKVGQRLLEWCRARDWPYSKGDVQATPPFRQCYVQRYARGTPESASVGFHHDERASFCELICGISLKGTGKLVLGATNQSEVLTGKTQAELRAGARRNMKCVELPPRSLYVMTGLARYDLLHAALQDGDEERISLTFRSLPETHRAVKAGRRVAKEGSL